MDDSMPPHPDPPPPPPPPPPRNPSFFSAMPPPPPPEPSPPPPLPKPSPPSSSSRPKAEAAVRPEESSAAEEASAKPGASSEGSPMVGVLSAEEAKNLGSGTDMADAAAVALEQRKQQRPRAPYEIPVWSAAPYRAFFLEVIKNDVSLGRLDLSNKGVHMFGRLDVCDFVLEHPSISRFHAVLQFRNDGEVYLYDLGSTHGSFVNKTQIMNRSYTKINLGDVISFGHSSRLYIFDGPAEILHLDVEAEITGQTYRGQLTNRQENTRSKIIKRMEEVANFKKEICAIRRIGISQAGGLTQGQQTKITLIEQRISQILEELRTPEETSNGSIQGSLGACAGKLKCGSHRASIKEDVILGEKQLVQTADTLHEKKGYISGIKCKGKLVEEKNYQRDNTYLQDDDGCSRDSIQRKPSSPTTIELLPEDTILEVFSRLPSIGYVIRAACSCSMWRNAVASSPLFRRKFLDLHPAPLLGFFFDAPSNFTPAFPTFVPVRNATVDVPVAVRWGDFFTTELQRQPVVPPTWMLSDVRGGLMLLVNPDDMLLVVDPFQGLSEGYFDPHEVRILMDYHGTNPRMLPPHLVCDETYTGRFTLIYLAHDISRVRASVFGSSIGGRGFSLPWFEVAPRQNQLDEEGGWLNEGVQAGESLYWLSTNHQFVVMLNTRSLVFSVEHLEDLNLNNLNGYAFGETRNGRLCLAYALGPRLVIMCPQNVDSVSGPWDIMHEASLQDLAISHGELRVSGIRKGIVYLMASRVFHQYGIPCWIATYDMQSHKVDVKCQWTSSDIFQPFYLPWPRYLSSPGQASAAKAKRHFQKFEKMTDVKDIVLVKAIYSCQIDVMKNPQNYRSWYKYICLEEKHGDKNKVRGIYEQALSILPAEGEKWFWENYIYLWLSYAIYEEECGNIESARKVYTRCLGVIPHETFTFSAVWTMAADLEIRQKDVEAARRILSSGIEKRPTAKLYKKLIDIEYWMNNCDVWRCLFETFLEWLPMNCGGWMEYAEKEHLSGEVKRARAIYERAIQQPSLDLPMKVLLKDYLYFEISENEVQNARALFEKLIIITKDVEAWINYAKYEASDDSNNNEMSRMQKCRSVFERALAFYSGELDKTEKLVKAWSKLEISFGICGIAISPEYILSSSLKRKRISSPHDISTEKRRKKDGGNEHRPH